MSMRGARKKQSSAGAERGMYEWYKARLNWKLCTMYGFGGGGIELGLGDRKVEE